MIIMMPAQKDQCLDDNTNDNSLTKFDKLTI